MGSGAGRGLRHPVFAAAVVVLLLNDRWWKAAAPGVVTGKLSDVAGVIVAALLLSVALATVGVGERRAAIGSAVLVGVLFTLMKTTSAGSAIAEAVWTSVNGGPNRVVVDPTDLVALLALPVVPWVGAGRARARPVRGSVAIGARLIVTVVALGAGLTATTATSCATPVEVDAVVPGENGLLLALDGGSTVAWSTDRGEHWVSTTGPPATSDPSPTSLDVVESTVPRPRYDLVPATEACIDDRCWHVEGGAVVRDDQPERVELAALDDSVGGCPLDGRVSSLIKFDRLDGPVLVASLGTQGIAVSSGNGEWERMPIAGTELPPAPRRPDAGMEAGVAFGLVVAIAALAWLVPVRPTQQRYRTRSASAWWFVSIAVALTGLGAAGIAAVGFAGGLLEPLTRMAGWVAIVLAIPFAYSGSREFRFPLPRVLDR